MTDALPPERSRGPRRVSGDTVIFGQPRAPVRLTWFVDYCDPACRLADGVIERVTRRYGPENVAVELHLLPGPDTAPDSELAALAALAAQAQGALGDMHGALMRAGPGLGKSDLIALARRCGLGGSRFAADLDDSWAQGRLVDDYDIAQRAGVRRAGTLLIDGQRYDGEWDDAALSRAIADPLGARALTASQDFFGWSAGAARALMIGLAGALILIHLGYDRVYADLRQMEVALSAGSLRFGLPLIQWTNEALLALLFLIYGIELKREVENGELSAPGLAAITGVAALGGMVVPALIYLALVPGLGGASAGALVPMASDPVLILGVLMALGPVVPLPLKVFAAGIALFDDLVLLVVSAPLLAPGIALSPIMIALLTLGVMLVLNRGRIYARAPYVLLGVLLWVMLQFAGLPGPLAGVLCALMIPARPSVRLAPLDDQGANVMGADPDRHGHGAVDAPLEQTLHMLMIPRRLQSKLQGWATWAVLPLFAFANGGLLPGSGAAILRPEALGVLVALVIGKPLGILGAVWLGRRLGLGALPADVTRMRLVGVACLAGTGCVMSAYLAARVFQGATLDGVRAAIILAGLISTLVGISILRRAHRAPVSHAGAQTKTP